MTAEKISAMYIGLALRERLFVLAGILLAAAALFAQCVLRPYGAYVNALDQQIAEKKILQIRYEALAAQRPAAEKQSAALASGKAAGTPEERSARLLKEAESLARSSALSLRHLRPAGAGFQGAGPGPGPGPGTETESVAVELEAAATLESVAAFLRKLQNPAYPIRVRKYHLSAGDADANASAHAATRLTVRITLDSPL